jgi:NAD(P)-dependent dehydrogenase (short-subunit alcohol dehydrogenase family)
LPHPGKEDNPNLAAYSAAKVGVIGSTKLLGKELAASGALVNPTAAQPTDRVPSVLMDRCIGDSNMRTIRTTATVTPDGTLIVQVPPDIAPGTHDVVVVIDEPSAMPKEGTVPSVPTISIGKWPENFPLRREDMYDDWGR